MKPYTRFLFRRARRVVLIWIAAIGVAYGLGAYKGVEERKNAAAASEAKMAQRIANKWPALLSQAEYMTGMPAKHNNTKRD